MAENNYLAEVNRARQPTRSGVRSRLDQIINSLDSAGEMDRLQGAEVNDFAPNYDSGGGGILATTVSQRGGGGGGVPAQTAGFIFNRGGGGSSMPVYSGRSSSPCGPGGCPVPGGGMITSTPTIIGSPSIMSGSTVVSSGIPIEASVVQAGPGTPLRKPGEDEADYYRRAAQGYQDHAFSTARSQPTTGALSWRGNELNWQLANELRREKSIIDEKKRVEELMRPAREAEVAKTNSEAAKLLSDARVNLATAQLATEASGVGGAAETQKLLNDVIAGKLNPAVAIEGAIRIGNATVQTDKQGRLQAGPAMSAGQRELAYRRLFIGGAAVGVLMRTYDAYSTARDGTTPAVGKDPATGQPVDTAPQGRAERASQANNIALENIVSGYQTMGLLGQDWHTVRNALYNDVYSPLEHSATQLFLTVNADKLSGLSGPERERAEAEYRDKAMTWAANAYGYMEAKVAEANAKAGGGTPEKPDISMFQQAKMWLNKPAAAPPAGASPQAWGAAPPMTTDRAE